LPPLPPLPLHGGAGGHAARAEREGGCWPRSVAQCVWAASFPALA
jgi:hypothetical protein